MSSFLGFHVGLSNDRLLPPGPPEDLNPETCVEADVAVCGTKTSRIRAGCLVRAVPSSPNCILG